MAQSPDTRTISSTGDTSTHKEGEPKGHTVTGHSGAGERTPAADASSARLSENTQQATHQLGDALRRSGAAGSEATRSEDARAMQSRYFAYCAAQLVECGLPVSGALATMKGDACDAATASEIQRWIQDGPEVMLQSTLLPAKERELWRAVFSQGQSAWPALRGYLVETYSLPFRPLPGR